MRARRKRSPQTHKDRCEETAGALCNGQGRICDGAVHGGIDLKALLEHNIRLNRYPKGIAPAAMSSNQEPP